MKGVYHPCKDMLIIFSRMCNISSKVILRTGLTAEAKHRGIAVEECGAADGTNFSIAEESTEGHWAKVMVKESGVKVGLLVEPMAPPYTGKHEGSHWGAGGGLVGVLLEKYF